MSQKNRTELRKKDFLVVKQTKNQNIAKIITPQTFQIGLDDDEFKKGLIVKGDVRVGNRLLDGTGSSFVKAGSNVTVTENTAGGITISAALGTGAVLSGGGATKGITAFSYDGSGAATVEIDLDTIRGGLDFSSNGLQVKPSAATFSVNSSMIQGTDLLLIEDVSDATAGTKKITVTDLLAAAPAHSTLANSVTARDGLKGGSFDNSGNINFDIDAASGGGLTIIGGGGSGGAIRVDPDNATATTSLDGANDYVLIHDAGANATRKILTQYFADQGSTYSLSAGTGLQYSVGSSYDGSANSTIKIDSSVVPSKSTTNTFTGTNTFSANLIASSGVTGSIQEVSSGVPYLLAGSNINITTGSNGQITIASTGLGSGALSAGTGIASFSFNGSGNATVAVTSAGLSAVSANRNNKVIVADASSPSTIVTTTIGQLADIVDRTAIMAEGTGIDITFSGNSNAAVIAAKLDSTLGTDGSGNITVEKVPNALAQGTGITAFSFDGSATATVGVDNSVVATLSGSQFSGDVGVTGSFGVEKSAIFNQGLTGSLQILPDGSAYLREGSNITITSGTDGSVTITANVTGGGTPGGGNSDKAAQYLVLAATGSLANERVLTAGTGISTSDAGAGGAYTLSVRNDVFATLSGSQFSGNVGITGSLGVESEALFNGGLSGSLQMLADGTTRYIVGIGGVKVSTASSGQIEISGSEGRVYTAGTGLDLTTNQFSVDNSVVATLTGSVFSGDVVTQAGLSGSLQMLADGATPYIIGTGSVSVTTSSSGQLVISSSGGSGGGGGLSTVSQAGGSTVNNVTKMVFTGSVVTNDGGGQVTIKPVIGAPEDGTYTDGLFTGFQYTTPIGTVIDRFNEVLLDLAPSPAPPLDDINTNDSGTTAFLSFGPAAAAPGYTNVGNTAGYGAVADVNDSYTVASNNKNLRRGIFSLSTVFDGRLNSDIAEARYANNQLNYPSYSFGDAEQGTMLLEVNGNVIHTASLKDPTVGSGNPGSGTYSTLNTNGSGFTELSVTASAKFNSGAEFNTFKHRTGNWKVATSDQRNGWNYARVSRVINSVTSSVTNYVEWVNDSDSQALSAANNKITAVDVGGMKELSGVKYFKSGTAEYRVDVRNAYRTCYDNNAITFTTTNLSISSISKPTINTGGGEDSSKVLTLTGSSTITDQTLLNGSVAASVNVTHPLKSNLTSGGSTTATGFLLYNVSDNSTATTETFRGESYRMMSGSFAAQGDVTGGSYDWNSSLHMSGSNAGHTDGLLFYNDLLVSPSNALGGLAGDFRDDADGGSLSFAPVGNPNYSGITSGVRTFYRKFQNTTGGSANSYSLAFNGSSNIVSNAGSLGSNTVKIYTKLPNDGSGNTTGWLDLSTLFTSGTYTDGSGARVYTADTTLDATLYGTLGTFDLANNGHLMLKVLADASWTGNISEITATFANSNAAASSNVSAISSDDDGIDAKLSFGSVKPVALFTNVAASAGVGSAANTNDQYLDGTPNASRLGIFDKTEAIDGPVNTDTSTTGFADGHTGTLKFEVNGSEVADAEINLAAFAGSGYPGSGAATSVNSSGTGFTNVSTAQPKTGSNNYPDFDKWFRTAKFNVATADQRNGWNYARVIHSVGGADRTTNYIEWVNDFYTTAMSYDSVSIGHFGGPTIFSLSGVKYFDNTSSTVSGSIFTDVSGSHSNIYYKDGDGCEVYGFTNSSIKEVRFAGTGFVAGAVSSDATVALPALDTSVANAQSRSLQITSSVNCTLATSLPESAHSAGARVRIRHPQKDTLNSALQTRSTFLIFSASDSSSVNLSENFSGELYRLQANNYATKADVISAANSWDSTANMNSASGHDDGLLIYNGKLYSPKAKGNSGNFINAREGGSYQGPDDNVNYSSLSNATRRYYRAFRNDTTSDVPEININLTGSAEIIPRSGGFASGSIGTNNFVHIDVKIPGQTAWLDLAKAGDTSNESDGDGCLKATLDQTIDSNGARILCSFQGATANGTGGGSPPSNNSDYVVIRIEADDDWTGNLDEINIGW